MERDTSSIFFSRHKVFLPLFSVDLAKLIFTGKPLYMSEDRDSALFYAGVKGLTDAFVQVGMRHRFHQKVGNIEFGGLL